jgi:hypothetical protein
LDFLIVGLVELDQLISVRKWSNCMRKSATNQLLDLTSGDARCHCYKKDRYKRSVRNVRPPDGQTVATLMLAAGLGCMDERFEHEGRFGSPRRQRRSGTPRRLNAECGASQIRRVRRTTGGQKTNTNSTYLADRIRSICTTQDIK